MSNVQVSTLSNNRTQLEDSIILELAASLRGPIVRSEDAGYDRARAVYNGMIDKRPALIVRAADVADVMTTVNFARENDLLLAIRGGGHNGGGLGTCDDGVMLDLSLLKGIRVDPQARTVRVQGGCTQGEADHVGSAFGLAVPAGIFSTTGIAGLTLGGGHGYLSRKYGLTIDNLLEADLVLADGSFVTASADQHEDLFWAIRGGGGNFGVVTSFLYRAHPVSTVLAGPMLWELERAPEMLRWYRDFLPAVPEDFYGFFAFMRVPPVPIFPADLHGKNVCGIFWCHTGTPAQAEKDLADVRKTHPPLCEHVGAMPFTALQSMFDPLLPAGLQWYWKGDFVRELSDEAIEEHLRYGSSVPSQLSTMHLYPIDGQVNRVAADAMAFRYRDVKWSMVICGIDPDPVNAQKITDWARGYWQAVHPYSAGGAYVNFMMEEGVSRVQATYGDNYDRLVAVKTKYDPGNLFRVNQNIPPKT